MVSGHHQPSPVLTASSDPSLPRQSSCDPNRCASGSRVAFRGGWLGFSSQQSMHAYVLPSASLSFSPSFNMGASSFSSSSFTMGSDSTCNIAPLIAMNPQQWKSYMMSQIVSALHPPFQRSKTIFPVPKALHEVRPQAYCPRLLYIGPIYTRRLAIDPMDCCKALCVKEFLRCCPDNIQLSNLIPKLFHQDGPPSVNYYGIPKYDQNILELLIFVDAVFILEFMHFLMDTAKRESNEEQGTAASYMWNHIHNQLTISLILRDLFIIGNQVPLLKVVWLAEYQNRREDLLSTLQYIIWRCSPFINISPETKSHFKEFQNLLGAELLFKCEHLLDCLYLACVMPEKENNMGHNNDRESSVLVSIEAQGLRESSFPKKLDRIPRVSELHKVGVTFKGVIGNVSTVKYDEENLVLKIPKLAVYDETECILRNLVAYELTSGEEGDICAYVILMDSLVDTSNDLAILYKEEVLENHLGSDEKLL